MIMSVEEFKTFVQSDLTDNVLEAKLQVLELLIRRYTNNNFQKRAYRRTADIVGGLFFADDITPFRIGDTVQITESQLNEGLYTVKEAEKDIFTVNETVLDEGRVLCTKIAYPKDVQMGVINMLKWDLENRDKVGIQSETLSRHSVTYFNMDGDNSSMGYPKSLLGFLKPYMKARF